MTQWYEDLDYVYGTSLMNYLEDWQFDFERFSFIELGFTEFGNDLPTFVISGSLYMYTV